ncbi:Mu phage protein [Shewanella oneidensis MR-1]|uniref:Mu phage protein n=1 Tax=Shewanella oneidensis (strain ATCC 700550 / JCM 31522 / CIP 106686 / LMG 19005 / NCIMB 14063 / MR-1) TaxID=211586 RepID=K4PSD4_SHEON|nr:Mu phage protein [Shewanella oneidensis MR-1]
MVGVEPTYTRFTPKRLIESALPIKSTHRSLDQYTTVASG